MLSSLRHVAKKSPLGSVVRWWRRWRRPLALIDPNVQQQMHYDWDTAAILRRALKRGGIGIDIGAHVGAILNRIVAAAPQGEHHAFEPLLHLAEQLRAVFPMVRVHQKAVGDAPSTTTFLHVVNDPGYSGLRRREYDRPDPVFDEFTVEVVRLDDVIGIEEKVAFIKLDIEGGEYHALRGALSTIRRCQPVIVFEAALRSTGCYGVSASELFDLIVGDMGYSVWTLCEWLNGGLAYSREAFEHNWQHGPEYYFVAGPAKRS